MFVRAKQFYVSKAIIVSVSLFLISTTGCLDEAIPDCDSNSTGVENNTNCGADNNDVVQENSAWSSIESVGLLVSSHGSAVLENKIYIIGGADGVAWTSVVSAYDTQSNKWEQKASLTIVEYNPVASVINGEIFVTGMTSFWDMRFEKYNPDSNSWTVLTPLPSNQIGLTQSVYNGKLYVFGGRLNGGATPINTVRRYDPLLDSWTDMASMPTARIGAVSAVFNDEVYVIGGSDYSNGPEENVVEIYNPILNSWRTGAPMPTPRAHMNSVVLGGNIYVLGGGEQETFDLVEAYDPINNLWTSKVNMPVNLTYPSASVVNDLIYVLGFSFLGQSVRNNKVYFYSPNLDE